MADLARIGPARPPARQRLMPCIHAGRRAALSVPAILLIGFALTVWFDILGPSVRLDAAPAPLALQQADAVVDGPLTAAAKGADAASENVVSSTVAAATALPNNLDGSDLDQIGVSGEADHDSPFSFNLASIPTGANASLYADWMAGAPDHLPLSRLAIPGTHDTMTHRIDLVKFNCQNSGLDVQLAAGIRYLDVRARVQVQPRPVGDSTEDAKKTDPLGIYHAAAYTGYEFASVAETVFAFLEAHPSEVVIMRLKEEALPINGSVSDPPGLAPAAAAAKDGEDRTVGSAPTPPFLQSWNHYRLENPRTAAGLAKYLYRFNVTEDPLFQTPPPSAIPTIGQLRGKILLLQEFPYFPATQSYLMAPLNATPWYGIPWELSSSLLQIEDYWQTPDLKHLDNKWDAVRDNLQAAAQNASAAESISAKQGEYASPLFLSHLSASVGVTPIDAAAGPVNCSVAGINDRTGYWLERGDDLARRAAGAAARSGHFTPVGVVMADFPGRRLIDAILRRNSFFKFREY
ncbi:hypothetical protein SEPCBS119000_001735 [Sporothrix epigloea]|uniref:Phosphatidylinositol-specific phospholipase C X domain-containing protein n=1 Tax=Sporothrix epigloea TaxID=1892477 RepID=A0ABP0DCA8_9PEZI